MSNNSIIECLVGRGSTTPARNELTALSIGTAETILTMGTDTSATTTAAYLSVPSQSSIAGAASLRNINVNSASNFDHPSSQVKRRGAQRPLFNSSSFDGRALRMRLQGHLTTGTSTATVTIQFYTHTAAQLSGATTLTGTGASSLISATAAATKQNFMVEATVIWDSNTTALTVVSFTGNIGGTFVAAGINSVTPITVTAANWALSKFVASVTFSANSSGNLFVPIEMALEEV